MADVEVKDAVHDVGTALVYQILLGVSVGTAPAQIADMRFRAIVYKLERILRAPCLCYSRQQGRCRGE